MILQWILMWTLLLFHTENFSFFNLMVVQMFPLILIDYQFKWPLSMDFCSKSNVVLNDHSILEP